MLPRTLSDAKSDGCRANSPASEDGICFVLKDSKEIDFYEMVKTVEPHFGGFLSCMCMLFVLTQNIICKKCQKSFQPPFRVDRRNVRGSGMTMCPGCGNMVSMTL